MIKIYSFRLYFRIASAVGKKLKVFHNKCIIILLACGLLTSTTAFSQLPTASEVAADMKIGWNLGNTLEAIGGETAWNPVTTTQQTIDGAKAAGFNTVRLPVSWDQYANQSTYEIDAVWMARVKEVVDYCINNNMYVILNIHWDGGWLENNVTTTAQASVNAKQQAYWTQIANYFKNYDEHLLFAGANEPHVSNDDSIAMSVLMSYYQTFVDAVRATGGNNSSRTLIIQGPGTDIVRTNNLMNSMPKDQIANRIMVEVHYYTPSQFCLLDKDADWGKAFYYWGNGYHSTVNPSRNATWGEESDLDNYFGMMETKFTSKGIPVVLGEFSATRRQDTIPDFELHLASRLYWNKYVVQSAVKHGMIPVCWDTGSLINRADGAVKEPQLLSALMEGVNSCVPTAITPYVQINGGSWTQTADAAVAAGGSVKFGPQPWGEVWSWSGPNGFVATTREITISNIQTSQAGTYVATYTNSNGCKSTQAFAVTVTTGTGSILREYWTGISGTAVSNLTSSVGYPNSPAGSEQITTLEGLTNWADNYGTRMRGYIHPPTTGSYTFWLAGDDNADLYLSTDADAENNTRIAYVDGWTSSRQWDKYSTQQSAPVILAAGQKYYVEVLHKEGSGGDNLAVAWQGPGITQQVISGNYLSPYDPGTIVVRARGVSGGEVIDLKVDGTTVATWTLTTSYADYTASGQGVVSVHFTNDGGARDVQVDYVTINGVIYQSENQVTNTGVWQNNTCGGSFSELLNCNGYISYATEGSSSARTGSTESERSIEAERILNDVVIYPNPTSDGKFSISLPEIVENSVVNIYDSKGRLVYEKAAKGKGTLGVDLKLKTGIYLVKVISQELNFTRKLIVQ